MSPLTLRRFRAERLLRRDFERLRSTVLAASRARLAARGVELARADLEACYSLAWHGLYAAQLSGERVESPVAWLTVVTFRRALDEHRARRPLMPLEGGQSERDLAAELDDRARLGALFEGIRERLGPRERQAAALCYLHGLSRAEAARSMGLSEPRLRKLMDGRGDGRPGVAAKIGELASTIESGAWCDGRGSLMRALAFGILEPGGERHELALMHHRSCPACRAYVSSLRGLAVLLPPAALPSAALAGRTGLAAGGGAARGAGTAGSAGGPSLAAAGAAGGASGGWTLASGPLGAKLAVGCLLLLGTGCATFGAGPSPGGHAHRAARRRPHEPARVPVAARLASVARFGAPPGAIRHAGAQPAAAHGGQARSSAPASAAAAREFGLEGAAGPAAVVSPRAHAASAGSAPAWGHPLAAAGTPVRRAAGASGGAASASGGAAAREFAPG
ncbi:MAG: hypothetical protein ACYDC2_00180 [Solirubrobacteraceae bacterium]